MDGFTALADPTRRRIIDLLTTREWASGDLADQFPISKAAVSQHLKVLREANLVRVRVDRQKRFYALNPTGFVEIDTWISRMRHFWHDRLDRLEEALRAENQDT